MPERQLIDYIKNQIELGISLPEIKNTLLSKGWKEEDINLAIDELNKIPTPQPVLNQEKNTETTTPKISVFQNLFKSKVALGVTILLGTLLFISFGVAGYYIYSQNNPDFIYKRAIINTLNIKNMDFEVKGSMNWDYLKINYNNTGQIEIGNSPQETKINTTIMITHSPIGFSNIENNVYNQFPKEIKFDLFFNNNELYFNPSPETRNLIFSGFYITNKQLLDPNKWIKVDNSSFSEIENYNVGNLKKLNDLLFNFKNVEIKFVESEKIDKVEYLKFSYKIPRETMDKFIDDFIKEYIPSASSEEVPDDFKQNTHKYLSNGFIWVNKKDAIVNKIIPTFPKDDPFKLSLEYNLKSYNKELNLQTPKNYIDFNELMNYNDSFMVPSDNDYNFDSTEVTY